MGVLGLGRENHLSELNSPLPTQEGVLTPAVRKARAIQNLGLTVASGGGVGGAIVYRSWAGPSTATGSATLTAAQLLAGVLHGTPAAAAAYTLPLATAIDSALPADFAVGDAFEFSIVNLAATATFDITVTTNTGWTLVGPMVVGAGSSAAGDGSEWTAGLFRARKTAAGAYTLYRVG